MRQKNERVTVRLPADLVDALKIIKKDENFSSVSKVIRAAIEEFIQSKSTVLGGDKVTIKLPSDDFKRLNQLVDLGYAVSIEEAAKFVLKDGLIQVLKKFLKSAGEWDKLVQKRGLVKKLEKTSKLYTKNLGE